VSKRFISMDTSTQSLAFAEFEGEELIQFGQLLFSGKGIYDKVRDIAVKTGGLFEAVAVENIVIESTFFSMNPKVTTNLAIAQGAILGAASVKGATSIAGAVPVVWQKSIGNPPLTRAEKLEVKESNPSKSDSWCKAQPRKIRKQRTIDIVNNKFGCNVTSDDVADAIGIGMYAYENWDKLSWR